VHVHKATSLSNTQMTEAKAMNVRISININISRLTSLESLY